MTVVQTEENDWKDLWATFSVRDHTRPGAFISEVLFYDKLVIPVVPTQADGLSDAEAKREWERWESAGWAPARQTQICAILRDRAAVIPWTAERQGEWKRSMADEMSAAWKDGFFHTAGVLGRFAPAMARTVIGVSHYTKLDELERETGIRRRQTPNQPLPGGTLLAVLGFEMLVPDNPDGDDFQSLADAVEVASSDDFRQARRDLFDWQKRFVRDGETDADSIRVAVDEMSELVQKLRRSTRRERAWHGLKRFFAFLGAASKGAALVPVPHVAAAASASGAIAAMGSWVLESHRTDPSRGPGLPAATLIAGAQERLALS